MIACLDIVSGLFTYCIILFLRVPCIVCSYVRLLPEAIAHSKINKFR